MKTFLKPALAAVLATLLTASPAFAKCTVTLKMSNGNGEKITVLGADSQARVNGGTWSKMGFSNTPIASGADADVPWTTNMSCGGSAKRDLRFKYQSAPNNAVFEEMVDNIDLVDGGNVRVTLKH
jgi:opacity protein-like surface antigen